MGKRLLEVCRSRTERKDFKFCTGTTIARGCTSPRSVHAIVMNDGLAIKIGGIQMGGVAHNIWPLQLSTA